VRRANSARCGHAATRAGASRAAELAAPARVSAFPAVVRIRPHVDALFAAAGLVCAARRRAACSRRGNVPLVTGLCAGLRRRAAAVATTGRERAQHERKPSRPYDLPGNPSEPAQIPGICRLLVSHLSRSLPNHNPPASFADKLARNRSARQR